MDQLARLYFQFSAKLALRTKFATEFQDHFNDLMEAVHGPDFIRVRPAGKVGDRKCDGYLSRTDTVFQVYAPGSVRSAAWIKKVDEDFAGARAQWQGMLGWTFVHNQHDGLPPDIAKALLQVKKDNADLVVEPWPPARLLDLSEGLTESQLTALFGSPPRDDDLRTLHRGDIAQVVAGLAQHLVDWRPDSDLPNVDPRKLDFNRLSEYPRRLITAGIAQSALVQGYFDNHPDPNLRDRIAARFNTEWMRLRSATSPDEAFSALY